MRHGTYSIVALDPATGELGAAVQSHWFSVGPLCIWARAGIGAVATQSVVEPAYASHVVGEHWSCQANMMARETVPPAMSQAFAEAGGALQDRLLAALEAAE